MPLDAWIQSQLTDRAELVSRPWALDVSGCNGHVDMGEIIRVCRKHGVTLAGVMGAGGGTLGQANSMGLALLPPAVSEPLQVTQVEPEPTPVQAPTPVAALGAQVVSTPVRSGQQVWAQARDLVLLGQVSKSAEVMADGSVFCYGPMNGRVAAGVSGNTDACIILTSLQAELVAVAGVFMALDDLSEHPFWGKPVQIRLVQDRLEIVPIRIA